MKTLLGFFFITVAIIQLSGQSTLSEDDKIFGLSQIWKEADKNFVFFDQIPDINWDSTYLKFIPIVKATQNDYSYFRELQRFCSLLKDGHSRVYIPWKLRSVYEVQPPIRTELIDDKIIIVEIQNDTVAEQGVKVGMELLEINGQDVKEYAEKNVTPFVFYSTNQDRDVQVYEKNLLKGPVDELLKIKTSDAGKLNEFTISRKLTSFSIENPIFDYSVIGNNTGHLKIYRFWGDDFEKQFDSIYPLIKKSARLIIDVSNNAGGNTYYANYVLKHFVNKPFYNSSWKTPKYMPAMASWGRELEWLEVKGEKVRPLNVLKRYKGKVVVLISGKTYSAGEDFVSAFSETGRGIALGRPTAGTTGNPIGFELLGVSGFQICSKRDYLPNGKEFVGYGIHPQIVVKKSLGDQLLIKEAMEVLQE